MTEKEAKKYLKHALEKQMDEVLSEIPPKEEIGHSFTPEFEEKMTKLIDEDKNKKISRLNEMGKRVAIIILAIAVMAVCGTMVTVKSGKKGNSDFYYRISKYKISVEDKNAQGNSKFECYYTLPVLPEGYKAKEHEIYEMFNTQAFSSSEGKVNFVQFLIGTVNMKIGITKPVAEQKLINGIEVLIFKSEADNIQYYLWYENGYGFTLITPTDVEETYFEQVIGKLIIFENK